MLTPSDVDDLLTQSEHSTNLADVAALAHALAHVEQAIGAIYLTHFNCRCVLLSMDELTRLTEQSE